MGRSANLLRGVCWVHLTAPLQSVRSLRYREEDLSHFGRGRSARWQHRKAVGRSVATRGVVLLQPLPTDFGIAAQKEQVKICDSIKSNIDALGKHRNELRELKQNMHQLSKSSHS